MDEIVQIYNCKVLLLNKAIEDEVIPNPEIADIWVVNHNITSKVKRFLRKVICSPDIRVYLKPIFLQREFEKEYEYVYENLYIEELSDGYIENLQILEKLQLVDRVNAFVTKYTDGRNRNNLSDIDTILQSIFDFYYTRKCPITPIRSHNTLSGYAYPRLEAHFTSIEDAYRYSRVLLQEAYLDNLLSREYVDTKHLCRKCGGGFLNYREICPKCKSHNLKVIPLIHHFRCAYIGPRSDFMYRDQMICPKCSSILHNLGVDYDSPGVTFVCKNEHCNNSFQHPPILVSCVDCNTDQYPDDLIVRKVYKYSFTEKGLQRFLSLN